MKPIRLIMSAFGSYGGVEQVDFEKIKYGLFLITGDTGAGKTTIFDGISFALYGQTSGQRRDGEMMRSQYASEEQETYVEFVFCEGKDIYRVRRQPAYDRKSRRKNKEGVYAMTRSAASVELTLPNGQVFSGKMKETDQKIVEIIGMDGDQFRQVSMISQGDFMRLLLASSKERKEIFSRIFPTEIYWRMQKRLLDREKELGQQLDEIRRNSIREIENVQCLPDSVYRQEWEETGQFSEISNKAAMDLLEAMNQECRIREQDVQNRRKKTEDLLAQIEKFEQTAAEADHIQAEQLKIQQQLQTDTETENRAVGTLSERERAYEAEWPDLKKEELLLKESMAEYEQMELSRQALERAEAKQKGYEDALKQIQVRQKVLQEKQSELSNIQRTLKDAPSQAVLAEGEKEISRRDLEGIRKLLERERDFLKHQASAEAAQENLLQSLERYHGLSRAYNETYDQFISFQAGLMAQSLRPGEPCPVCGSVHHPAPNALRTKAISQTVVDKAKKAREDGERVVESNRENLHKIQTELAGLRSSLIESGGRWLENPEVLLDKGSFWEKVKIKESGLGKSYEEVLAKWKQLVKDAEAFRTNQRNLEGLEQELEQLQAELLETTEGKTRWTARAESCRQQWETMGQKLRFESREAAEEREKQLHFQMEHLENSRIKARKDLEAVRSKNQMNRGRLEERRRKAEQLSGEVREMEKHLETACQMDGWDGIPDKRLLEEQKRNRTSEEKQIYSLRCQNEKSLMRLKVLEEDSEKIREAYRLVHHLSRAANGQMPGKPRIDFQTYMQRHYFQQIVAAANQRLIAMSDHQFLLECRNMEHLGRQGEVGLDLDVYSLVNDRVRDVRTLSGGESFMAALALALGMADVIQRQAGKIHVDTLFIDEGFGSLDEKARNQAVQILGDLAGKDRLVGIISHVSELKEQIGTKIIVKKRNSGSHIFMDVSV